MSSNPRIAYGGYTHKSETLTCLRQVNLPTLGNKSDVGSIKTMVSIPYGVTMKVS